MLRPIKNHVLRGFLRQGVLVALAGCTTLYPDLNYPPAELNYPLAEIWVGGELHLGLASILVTGGSQHPDIAVKGYIDGKIKISSNRCGIDKSILYSDSELIRIPLPEKLPGTCILDISVHPDFSDDINNKTETYNLIGRVLVKVIEAPTPWYGSSEKVIAGGKSSIKIPINYQGEYKIYLRGCNLDKNLVMAPDLGALIVDMDTSDILSKKCIIEGVAINVKETIRFTHQLWVYDNGYNRLPSPKLSWSAAGLSVYADKTSAYISVDDRFKLGNEGIFPLVRKSEPHIIRSISTQGRAVVCIYTPERELMCQN